MLVSNIDDVSLLLTQWYSVRTLGVTPNTQLADRFVPKPLSEVWTKLGRLFAGYEAWVKTGSPSPLACQDGLAAPDFLVTRNGYTHVISENQGNWTMCYREHDQALDPDMFSDFLEQDIGGTGYVPMGCKLSSLLITSVLTETVFFGSVPNEEAQALEPSCDREVWAGRYYNAVGFGPKYEASSHHLRTNADNSALALYWDNEFSGFLAQSNVGQERLRSLIDFSPGG